MRNTQAKFMAAAKALTDGTDLEFVNDTKWANTGTLRLQPLGAFRTLMRVEYDFQDNATSLTFGPAIPGLRYPNEASSPGWFYARTPADLQLALDAMATFIKEVKL